MVRPLIKMDKWERRMERSDLLKAYEMAWSKLIHRGLFKQKSFELNTILAKEINRQAKSGIREVDTLVFAATTAVLKGVCLTETKVRVVRGQNPVE
jgi:hypothetical protein